VLHLPYNQSKACSLKCIYYAAGLTIFVLAPFACAFAPTLPMLMRRSGTASGMNAAARYVGWSLGFALVSLTFGLGGDHSATFCLVAGMTFALMGAATSSVRQLR
jgi:hypothetical protein